MNRPGPDLHAIKIAQAAQAEVAPARVILFGSRATGRYHQESDLDLLVVAGDNPLSAENRVYQTAQAYMRRHPPRLELNVIGMTRQKFNRCRRANQHIAGQAARYGVVMSNEGLDYPTPSEAEDADGYPDHWPETGRRIERAQAWNLTLQDLTDMGHTHQEASGFTAQQAVENALKGWLSAHNDVRTFGHELRGLWEDIIRLEDWTEPELNEVYQAVAELFEYTYYPDSRDPEIPRDWLSNYAAVYRYGGTDHEMTAAELQELKERVNRVVESVVNHIYSRSGVDRGG